MKTSITIQVVPGVFYSVFYCKAHNKHIYYIKGKLIGDESPCWDCWRDVNL